MKNKRIPIDDMSFFGLPYMYTEADEVHISVAFTYDLPEAERLEKQWKYIAPVKIGGPATGQRGEDFTPGMYLKMGYVIISRGCPNRCWFCSVWRREGKTIRELPITNGWNILDDNLLACSEKHIREVLLMLSKQKNRIYFTGGLEAARLQLWHVQELKKLKPKELFFAYDGPEDREPLFEAGKLLLSNGFTKASNSLRAYVLIGYPGDTLENAEHRLYECMQAGFLPMAMLYRDKTGNRDEIWRKFAWQWSRPAIYSKTYKEMETVKNEYKKI
jgi:hypothetical protein